MKIQLTTLALVLCLQFNAFSMFDCDCSWDLDLVCIQADDGNIIPFPNACWANCLGYTEADFIDCDYDTSYDPTCGCDFEVAPVCVEASSGEIVLFSNSCIAECNGYETTDFLDCNYDLPTDPNCGCNYELDEVCVEVEEGIFMPFPNPCWANCLGYTEDTYVDCGSVVDFEILVHAELEVYYDMIISDSIDSEIPANKLNLNQVGNKQIETNIIQDIEVYPNPVDRNTLSLKMDLKESVDMRIDLLSVTGKLYKSIAHSGGKGFEILKVDVSDLPSGIYYLNIYSGKNTTSKKFVKQ